MSSIYSGLHPIKLSKLDASNPYPSYKVKGEGTRIYPDENLNEHDRVGLFTDANIPLLPYTPQDQYDRAQAQTEIKAIYIENDHIKVRVYPQYGGRIASIYDKKEQRELLFDNPVLQPANLALRNAWFSGGVEFNGPRYGHSLQTCEDVYCARLDTKQGPLLRIYEFDRALETTWQVDLQLDKEKVWIHTHVINPNPYDIDFYWWTNLAVPATDGTRVLSPSTKECIEHSTSQTLKREPYPYQNGKDLSFQTSFDHATSIFFDAPTSSRPWVAAIENNGKGVLHCSNKTLKGRKYFIWGTNTGGKRWMEFLSDQQGGSYLEIQAGLTATQLQTTPLPSQKSLSWTECILPLQLDPKSTHQNDVFDAIQDTEEHLEHRVSSQDLRDKHGSMSTYENLEVKAENLLHQGSPWGALTQSRNKNTISTGLLFIDQSTPMINFYKHLIQTETLGDSIDDEIQESDIQWVSDERWFKLLSDAQPHFPKSWLIPLLKSTYFIEQEELEQAEKECLSSIENKKTSQAYRNLAIIAKRRKDVQQARLHYLNAIEIAPHLALIIEISEHFIEMKEWDTFKSIYDQQSSAHQSHERLNICLAQYHMHHQQVDEVLSILKREFVSIREGEATLTDLWFNCCYLQHQSDSELLTETEKRQIRIDNPPPRNIDFRMWLE